MHKDCTQAVKDLIESKVTVDEDENDDDVEEGEDGVKTKKKKNRKPVDVIVKSADKISGTQIIYL